MGDAQLTLVTGSPDSGKSYWMTKKVVREVLPYWKDKKVLTNIPMLLDPERVQVEDFQPGWLPPGDTFEERCESVRDTYVIIDEAWGVLTKENEDELLGMVALARKRNTHWYWMAQSKEDFPKRVQDLARYWIECYNGEDLRDESFGIRYGDLQNVSAKLTGQFREFFQRQEYRFINRRWTPVQRVPWREWFNPRIGECYDTKQGFDNDESGRARVVKEYELLTLWQVLSLAARRNVQCLPAISIKIGIPLVLVGGGLVWGYQSLGKRPALAVVTPADRAAVEVRKEVAKAVASPVPVAPVRPPVARRVATWLLLIGLAVVGCKGPSHHVGEMFAPAHVSRAGVGPEPHVAAYGAGHSLDSLLGSVGVVAETGLEVDGPLVGREVLDAARAAGYSVQGDKLVPARKRAVAVPQEIGNTEETIDVGGFPVKMVDEAEVEQWRELGSVVHEAYRTELLVCSVTAAVSREVSAIVSGNGTLTVSHPAAVVPFTGRATVALAMQGSVVEAKEVARPVLTSAPGASANVHVGQKIPVRLATSSTTNGSTQTTIGSTLQFIQTGTKVEIKPERVSASQVRLSGSVTISQQTATVDGVPSTSERALTVDHLVKLDDWTVLGRLDSAAVRTSRGWLSLGNLRATSDETFLVVARVIQVHRDEGLHGVKAAASDLAVKVVEVPAKPEAAGVQKRDEAKPDVKPPIEIKRDPVKVTVKPSGVTSPSGTSGNTSPHVDGAKQTSTGSDRK